MLNTYQALYLLCLPCLRYCGITLSIIQTHSFWLSLLRLIQTCVLELFWCSRVKLGRYLSLRRVRISVRKKNLMEKSLLSAKLSLTTFRWLLKSMALSWLFERSTLLSLRLFIRLMTVLNLLFWSSRSTKLTFLIRSIEASMLEARFKLPRLMFWLVSMDIRLFFYRLSSIKLLFLSSVTCDSRFSEAFSFRSWGQGLTSSLSSLFCEMLSSVKLALLAKSMLVSQLMQISTNWSCLLEATFNEISWFLVRSKWVRFTFLARFIVQSWLQDRNSSLSCGFLLRSREVSWFQLALSFLRFTLDDRFSEVSSFSERSSSSRLSLPLRSMSFSSMAFLKTLSFSQSLVSIFSTFLRCSTLSSLLMESIFFLKSFLESILSMVFSLLSRLFLSARSLFLAESWSMMILCSPANLPSLQLSDLSLFSSWFLELSSMFLSYSWESSHSFFCFSLLSSSSSCFSFFFTPNSSFRIILPSLLKVEAVSLICSRSLNSATWSCLMPVLQKGHFEQVYPFLKIAYRHSLQIVCWEMQIIIGFLTAKSNGRAQIGHQNSNQAGKYLA